MKYVAFLIALLAFAMPAQAKTPANKKTETLIPAMPPIIADYDVYVGGLHLINAQILFEEQKGTYRSRVHAKTYGVWYKVLPWDNILEVHGDLKRETFAPREYSTTDDWNHNPKTTKLHFKKNGDVVPEFVPPSGDENREIVTKEQRMGSVDPITGLLQLLAHVSIHKSCNTVVPIFDGKRRFDVTGVDKGTKYVDEEDYGIFKGDARVCTAEFTMISGEWKDRKPSKFWQKSDKENGRDPFLVYMAPLGPNNIDLAFRLESSSVFGMIIGHLTSWRYAMPQDMK